METPKEEIEASRGERGHLKKNDKTPRIITIYTHPQKKKVKKGFSAG